MEANTYFYTAQGEYSDYGVNKHYKSLIDFSFIETCKEWVILHNIDADRVEFTEKSFRFVKAWDGKDLDEVEYFKYLVEAGYLEELDFMEMHTGRYGDTKIHEH